jgi:hypothetical protein
MTVAKAFTWLGGSALAACIGLGLWIGVTVTRFDGRISSLENNRMAWDGQFSAMQAVDDEQSRRITALEITITGLVALRERMDLGFDDISKRLDKMEESAP